MVIQDEDDASMEEPASKKTKKYIVVKNHVRELLPDDEGAVLLAKDNKIAEKSNTLKRKYLRTKERFQKVVPSVSTPTDISECDLDELRTVYNKCKAVLQKIESKYGHLLNLDDNETVENSKKSDTKVSSCECSCSQKKKIVFDENGHQIEKDCLLENHVCLKRTKKSHSESKPHKASIQIEYDNINPKLPNDLQELENILKDVNIDKNYRQMVIDKIYLVRQEYLNEIRYEKWNIIKQLKENPGNVLDFKGTNLSSLQGYPTEPIEQREKSGS